MSNMESYTRLIASSIILVVSVATSQYILMFIAMALAYTGIKKHCFLYKFLNINRKLSLKNYYMSHLPKYNPSAVFMFDKNGEIYLK